MAMPAVNVTTSTLLQGEVPAASAPVGLGDMPAELLPAVLCWLDHDSLFCALQVSRAWRTAAAQPDLWEHACQARGWAPRGRAEAAEPGQPATQQNQHQRQQDLQDRPQQQGQLQEQQWQRQQPQQPQRDQQEAAPAPDWQQVYRQHYAAGCYDCFQPTTRHTLKAGSLRVRLCRSCSLGYESPRPLQRLVSATHAKRQCCLKDAGGSHGGQEGSPHRLLQPASYPVINRRALRFDCHLARYACAYLSATTPLHVQI